MRSEPNITQLVETNVTLRCVVIANPVPEIVWQQKDENGRISSVPQPSGNPKNGTIVITDAGVENSGEYTCTATNNLGKDSYRTNVTIKPGEYCTLL